jgi:hypothetical protein
MSSPFMSAVQEKIGSVAHRSGKEAVDDRTSVPVP